MLFASTSKITYAGAGVAFLGGSVETVKWYIGKPRQGRHRPGQGQPAPARAVLRLPAGRARPHAQAPRDHRAEVRGGAAASSPSGSAGSAIASWTEPTGGYFVSLDLLDGTASRVVQLAKEAGVSLTPAGASFPNGEDPRNRNIRLAPTFPPLPEVNEAMEAVATCALLAAAEKVTAERSEGGAEASQIDRGSEAEDVNLRSLGDPTRKRRGSSDGNHGGCLNRNHKVRA